MKISNFADYRVKRLPYYGPDGDENTKCDFSMESGENHYSLEEIYDSLSPYRRAKADSLKNENLRMQSIFGGALLEEMLRDKGIEEPFVYKHSDRSKPLMDGIFFSLSHCRKWVACITSSEPVGIDVEMYGRYKASVASRFFTKEESDFISKEKESDFYFTYLWTCKEAVAKCLDLPLLEICKKCDMLDLLKKEKENKENGKEYLVSEIGDIDLEKLVASFKADYMHVDAIYKADRKEKICIESHLLEDAVVSMAMLI